MRHSYLEDPSRAYSKVLVLIFIASECLGQNNNLVDIYKTVILYQRAGLGVKYSILLYRLLIIFVQALRVLNRSIPIREVFSLGLRDLIRLLINIELYQPIFFIQRLNLEKYTKKLVFFKLYSLFSFKRQLGGLGYRIQL